MDAPGREFIILLKTVNSTDLKDAIALGYQTIGNVFNKDDNDIPYFATTVRPYTLMCFSEYHSEAHTLRARMKGDTVLKMDNEGTDFTFFPPFAEK